MADYAGNWELGVGFTAAFNGTTYADPLYIELPNVTAFEKHLATAAGGLHRLIGRRNEFGNVRLAIADGGQATGVGSTPTTTTLTVTRPDATAHAVNAALIGDERGRVGPDSEVLRILTFALKAAWPSAA
jgi:hypothetical protein